MSFGLFNNLVISHEYEVRKVFIKNDVVEGSV